MLQIEVGRPTMFDMKFKIYIIARFAGPTIHKLFEHILQSFEKKTLCIKWFLTIEIKKQMDPGFERRPTSRQDQKKKQANKQNKKQKT